MNFCKNRINSVKELSKGAQFDSEGIAESIDLSYMQMRLEIEVVNPRVSSAYLWCSKGFLRPYTFLWHKIA